MYPLNENLVPQNFGNFGEFNALIVSADHNDLNQQLGRDLTTTKQEVTSRMFNAKLAALRAQNPFVPFLPLPDKVITLNLSANNPADINVPQGSQFLRFSGNADYYISMNGNASVPTVADNTNNAGNSSIYKPEDVFYTCQESLSLSAVAPANAIVTVQIWMQL